MGVSVSWILLALISFNRPILGRYLDGRLRRTAPMSTLTSPSNTHMLIRHRPDMCCMPAQPCAVPQMLSCIIRRVQYSCTTFSTALYGTRWATCLSVNLCVHTACCKSKSHLETLTRPKINPKFHVGGFFKLPNTWEVDTLQHVLKLVHCTII